MPPMITMPRMIMRMVSGRKTASLVSPIRHYPLITALRRALTHPAALFLESDPLPGPALGPPTRPGLGRLGPGHLDPGRLDPGRRLARRRHPGDRTAQLL